MTLSYASCFFFNDTATTEIYTLSLHDALPISVGRALGGPPGGARLRPHRLGRAPARRRDHPARTRPQRRSEEHTSELQSRQYLVCRLLLEKKKILLLSAIVLVAHLQDTCRAVA